jgi:uncharacterized protein YggE
MPSLRITRLALLLAPLALPAQAPTDTTIAVSITRTSRVLADRAAVLIGVEGASENARDAMARAETAAAAVTEALRKLALPVSIERPVIVMTGDNPALRGFQSSPLPTSRVVRFVIRVLPARLEHLTRILPVAVDAGAKGMVSFAFESSAADSVRRTLVADAAAAARQEAVAAATALGGRVGALLSATTSGGPSFQGPSMVSFDNTFSMSNQSPEVMVSVTLTARYRLLR